jgi:hypothetical protein
LRKLAGIGLLVLSGVVGCTTVPTIDPKDPGRVSGYLMVFWDGYDNFIYYPYYADPLTYTLPKGLAQRAGYDTIRPGAMFTDGGSIPQAVRNWTGLSPWGYGPAYIVHDWLFIARHCNKTGQTGRFDERDRKEARKVESVDFQLSADVLAAVIQALVAQDKVPKHDFAPKAIYTAVDSGIARNLWNSDDPDGCKLPSEKVLKDIHDKLAAAGNRAFVLVPGQAAGRTTLIYQQKF